MDLTHQQAEILQRLDAQGFQIVAFPMYASYIGVRKGECVALLAQAPSGGFTIFGTPTCMVGDNVGARVTRGDGDFFVWKNEKLDATPQLTSQLDRFSAELTSTLNPSA